MSKKPRHLRVVPTIDDPPALSPEQSASLRRVLDEAETFLAMAPQSLRDYLALSVSKKPAPPPMVAPSVKNVVAAANRFSNDMWYSLDELLTKPRDLEELRFSLAVTTDAIESICQRQGSSVHLLKTQSKQSFFWMKFLQQGDNLMQHLNALKIAKDSAVAAGIDVEVHLVNSPKRLYSCRTHVDWIEIKAHEGFICAAEEQWKDLLEVAQTGCLNAKSRLSGFALSDQFNEIEKELITMMCRCNMQHNHLQHETD